MNLRLNNYSKKYTLLVMCSLLSCLRKFNSGVELEERNGFVSTQERANTKNVFCTSFLMVVSILFIEKAITHLIMHTETRISYPPWPTFL